MELLKIIIFEYLLGYIIQGFSIVLGVYALNRQKIVLKNYILTSAILIIISFFVRLLPISFGIHTILNMLFLFLVSTTILKINSFSAIRASLLVMVSLMVIEILNVTIIINIIGKEQFESFMINPINKAIVGLPGVLAFAILIILVYFILSKEKIMNGDNYGDIGKEGSL